MEAETAQSVYQPAYGLEIPVIEYSWGAKFSAPVQTGPGAYPVSCTMKNSFFGGGGGG